MMVQVIIHTKNTCYIVVSDYKIACVVKVLDISLSAGRYQLFITFSVINVSYIS